MLKNDSSTSIHTYRKKMPRGLFTHFLALYDSFPNEVDWHYFWLFVIYIPSLFRSYLKTSTQGLELYLWPAKPLIFNWDIVTHLEKKKIVGVINYDRLYLDRPLCENHIVIALTRKSRERIDAQKKYIVLSDFVGWPNGGLSNDLRCFVPQLFNQEI